MYKVCSETSIMIHCYFTCHGLFLDRNSRDKRGAAVFHSFSAQTLGGSGVFLLELTLSVRVTAGGVYES